MIDGIKPCYDINNNVQSTVPVFIFTIIANHREKNDKTESRLHLNSPQQTIKKYSSQ